MQTKSYLLTAGTPVKKGQRRLAELGFPAGSALENRQPTPICEGKFKFMVLLIRFKRKKIDTGTSAYTVHTGNKTMEN